ncbi:MAG TPA: NAD(P)H-dependent glycerol-3-phosphate dehydrogenase [Spirochaetota bacterium]|nr:NAD(P)H-dependent glycerol-3-phosphate dehydrogenase [Spirochaetota bacterium]
MQHTADNAIMKAVTVIGAGSWGTAVANVIAHNHPEIVVRMWAYEKDVARSVNSQHINTLYLPDVQLANNIVAYTDLKESVRGTDAVIVATPSKVVYDTCTRIRRYLDSKVYVGYLSKGFCKVGSGIYTMSQTIELALPFLMDKVCALYGPSHAEEVCREYHTALHVASKSKSSINFFMNLLQNEYLECIPSDDIIGVDCGSTLKNPAAIAAGIISNLPQCGDNLAGALIAQAHAEMIQLGRCLGAKEQTIMGIAGLGDLVATALSQHSRNRRFGREIAEQITQKGTTVSFFDKLLLRVKPENVLERMSKRMHYLVEGAYAIEPILELADKYNLTMPVYRSLYDVLLNKRDPWLLIETIKNPAKYAILTRRARIKVKERKKGIERMSGMIFKNIVVEQLVQQLCSESKKLQVLANSREYKELLKQYLPQHKEYSHELSLYNDLNEAQYEKQLKTIIEFYYNSISDRYVYTFSLLILKLARMFFYLYGLLYRRRITEFFEERIGLSGDIKYLKKTVMTANPVYFCNAKDQADSLFVVLALIKFISIPLPRFYVDSRLMKNKLLQFLFRLCGGYIVHTTRCASILYRETLLQYMLSCVEHGIPVLYSNSMDNESQDELVIQDMVIEGLCALLQKTTEEIAVIPVGIGHKYYNPVTHPVSFLKLFRNVTKVHISRPITLSHFSASPTLAEDTKMMLKVKQRHDIPIYPHYFVAYVLHVSGGSAHVEAIKAEIDSILKLRNLKHLYSVEDIMREGVDFLISNNYIARSGETVVVLDDKQEAITYFAGYIV